MASVETNTKYEPLSENLINRVERILAENEISLKDGETVGEILYTVSDKLVLSVISPKPNYLEMVSKSKLVRLWDRENKNEKDKEIIDRIHVLCVKKQNGK